MHAEAGTENHRLGEILVMAHGLMAHVHVTYFMYSVIISIPCHTLSLNLLILLVLREHLTHDLDVLLKGLRLQRSKRKPARQEHQSVTHKPSLQGYFREINR